MGRTPAEQRLDAPLGRPGPGRPPRAFSADLMAARSKPSAGRRRAACSSFLWTKPGPSRALADVHAVCYRRRERLGRPLGSSVRIRAETIADAGPACASYVALPEPSGSPTPRQPSSISKQGGATGGGVRGTDQAGERRDLEVLSGRDERRPQGRVRRDERPHGAHDARGMAPTEPGRQPARGRRSRRARRV